MNSITTEQLEALKFTKYADLTFSDAGISFSYQGQEDKEWGHVYLWLEREGDTLRVAYVGKAGKTMKDRCRQHLSGFSGKSKSRAGLRNAANLQQGHSNGFAYYVFSKKSDVMEILGETIPLHSAEEEALIKKFSPPWNRL